MRLGQNLPSLNVYRNYVKNLNSQSKAMNKINSGNRLDSFRQEAVAYGQSESFRLQLGGYSSAMRNIQDNVSMLQTAEGGMANISESLLRIRTLVISAGSAKTEEDKKHILGEINQNLENIDYISKNTEFNGLKVLRGQEKGGGDPDVTKVGQVMDTLTNLGGNNVEDKVEIPLYNLSPKTLGLIDDITDKSTSHIDLNKIDESLEVLDKSINSLNSIRSKYGAIETRLEDSYNNVSEIYETIQGAESELRDSHIGLEMSEVAKYNILIEAGQAIMVQTNRFPMDILRILENVK
ncbi:flagellin [Hathewaya massiliensis]|uniref:flagellin N-terminal helical domain-containing protein n=1 Tax=Hathewaya massiliensis TaxID=1964382 RepID=UPI001159E16E|nr:flagellin [Hathewaya massiliensis]